MSHDVQAHERINEIEMFLAGKHPEEQAFLDSLKHKYGTAEEKTAQAEKAAKEAAAAK